MVKIAITGIVLLVIGATVGIWPRNLVEPVSDLEDFQSTSSRSLSSRETIPGATTNVGYLGVMLAGESVDVSAEFEGTLDSVSIRVGDTVRSDAVIARIDPGLIVQDLEMAEASLRGFAAERERAALGIASARNRLARRETSPDLFSAEEIAEARFQQEMALDDLRVVEAQIEEREARVDQLEEALGSAEVRSPFDGVVAVRYLDAGATVARGTPLIRLVNIDSLQVRFGVPGEASLPLTPGARVGIRVPGAETLLSGVIETVAPEVDEASGMILVEARLVADNNRLNDIQAGDVVRVFLETEPE